MAPESRGGAKRPIRALLPMACDGDGPSQTCLNIINGAHLANYEVDVFSNRCRVRKPLFPMTVAVPGPLLAQLPYQMVATRASSWTERKFINSIRPGDVAYLWPAASLNAHRLLFEKGVPVVLEAINTRMSSAKLILDAAYDAFGTYPRHGITEARIAEEEEKFHYTSAIFAPNQHVEQALSDSPLQDRIIPTSYGVNMSRASCVRSYQEKTTLTIMFCGYACVRKGVHFLLDAWQQMPGNHRLQIVGNIEPLVSERYAEVLNGDRVDVVGFVDDVHPYFAKADIFVMPSLEEGGPQVTYEAALHGLSILASPMGASRLGEIEGTMLIVDPSDTDAFSTALERLITSVELRRELGQKAKRLVPKFDWNRVGALRAKKISEMPL